jgi:hypothetical protein
MFHTFRKQKNQNTLSYFLAKFQLYNEWCYRGCQSYDFKTKLLYHYNQMVDNTRAELSNDVFERLSNSHYCKTSL